MFYHFGRVAVDNMINCTWLDYEQSQILLILRTVGHVTVPRMPTKLHFFDYYSSIQTFGIVTILFQYFHPCYITILENTAKVMQ